MNYTTLVSLIVDTMEDAGIPFKANIDGFIERASSRLYRDIDTYSFVTVTSVVGSAGDAFITAPSGESVIKNINFLVSGERVQLKQKTDEYLLEYWPIRTSTGVPKYYARIRDAAFYIAPTPVSSYTYEVTYIKRPVTISAGAGTNFYTEEAPNALFAASMAEANRFNKAWDQANLWEQEYAKEVGRLSNEARRTRRDDRTGNTRPGGADNTVEGNN